MGDGSQFIISEDGTLVRCLQYSGEVVVPDGVKAIGGDASAGVFVYNKDITGVTIPDSVTTIGAGAFRGCSGLESVTIPDGVTEIGRLAFRGCAGLKSITIPKSVKRIGIEAFYKCSGLADVKMQYGVTNIDCGAFRDCVALESISVPDSVTRIGDSAFRGCKELKSAKLSENLSSIETNLFSGCAKLAYIKIPDSVTSIQSWAFENCAGLTELEFSRNVSQINDCVFFGCTGVESISVDEGNSFFHGAGNCLINSRNKALVFGCRNSVISADGSVTVIGANAFKDCAGLESVTIPESIKRIRSDAFAGCTGLRSVNVASLAAWCGIAIDREGASNPLPYARELLVNGEPIKDVVIPEGVTSIAERAFFGCASITSVTLPEGVINILDDAFRGCAGLTSVTVPDSVRYIEKDAFSDCPNLAIFALNGAEAAVSYAMHMKIPYISFVDSAKIGNDRALGSSEPLSEKDLKLLWEVRSIDGFSVEICGYNGTETDVEIPSVIGGKAVKSVSASPSVLRPYFGIMNKLVIPFGVTYIGKRAFRGCLSLESVTIPESAVSVGSRAFDGCAALKSVIIPAGVTSIGERAFFVCEGLTIHGSPGSVAEAYARENGIKFEAI